MVKNIMISRKFETGDIVAIRWKDAFRYEGDVIPEPLIMTSWGKISIINQDGYGITQNEADPNQYGVERNRDAQFIFKSDIVEIKKL